MFLPETKYVLIEEQIHDGRSYQCSIYKLKACMCVKSQMQTVMRSTVALLNIGKQRSNGQLPSVVLNWGSST